MAKKVEVKKEVVKEVKEIVKSIDNAGELKEVVAVDGQVHVVVGLSKRKRIKSPGEKESLVAPIK